MRELFDVISTVFEEEKVEYILAFLSYSKDFKLFENIPLFPTSYGWSGSEVPLIDRRISFIKGLNYIEHQKYLKDKLQAFKKYIKAVQIKEYLEEDDTS